MFKRFSSIVKCLWSGFKHLIFEVEIVFLEELWLHEFGWLCCFFLLSAKQVFFKKKSEWKKKRLFHANPLCAAKVNDMLEHAKLHIEQCTLRSMLKTGTINININQEGVMRATRKKIVERENERAILHLQINDNVYLDVFMSETIK